MPFLLPVGNGPYYVEGVITERFPESGQVQFSKAGIVGTRVFAVPWWQQVWFPDGTFDYVTWLDYVLWFLGRTYKDVDGVLQISTPDVFSNRMNWLTCQEAHVKGEEPLGYEGDLEIGAPVADPAPDPPDTPQDPPPPFKQNQGPGQNPPWGGVPPWPDPPAVPPAPPPPPPNMKDWNPKPWDPLMQKPLLDPAPLWQNGQTYGAGDRVKYNGGIWQCTHKHDASPTNAPGPNNPLWIYEGAAPLTSPPLRAFKQPLRANPPLPTPGLAGNPLQQFSPRIVYKTAIITCKYSALSADETILTHGKSLAPKGQGWAWTNTGTDITAPPDPTKILPENISMIVPTSDFSFTKRQVLTPDFMQIMDMVGSVNASTFLGYAPYTVRFDGADGKRTYLANGTPVWELHFKFAINKNEWLREFNPWAGEYQYLKTVGRPDKPGSQGNLIYNIYDFSIFLSHR